MIKTTTIKADTAKELIDLYSNLKDIASTWCKNHPNYEFEIKTNHKELSVELRIEKLS